MIAVLCFIKKIYRSVRNIRQTYRYTKIQIQETYETGRDVTKASFTCIIQALHAMTDCFGELIGDIIACMSTCIGAIGSATRAITTYLTTIRISQVKIPIPKPKPKIDHKLESKLKKEHERKFEHAPEHEYEPKDDDDTDDADDDEEDDEDEDDDEYDCSPPVRPKLPVWKPVNDWFQGLKAAPTTRKCLLEETEAKPKPKTKFQYINEKLAKAKLFPMVTPDKIKSLPLNITNKTKKPRKKNILQRYLFFMHSNSHS